MKGLDAMAGWKDNMTWKDERITSHERIGYNRVWKEERIDNMIRKERIQQGMKGGKDG